MYERIGKYHVIRAAGSGGFGTVYEGYDVELDRNVAIKICTSADEGQLQRFRLLLGYLCGGGSEVEHPAVFFAVPAGFGHRCRLQAKTWCCAASNGALLSWRHPETCQLCMVLHWCQEGCCSD